MSDLNEPKASVLTSHSIENTLQDTYTHIESSIRKNPTDASLRWSLFQMLCVQGEWHRALQQLQVYHKLQPDSTLLVSSMRDLIRAETVRSAVFAGTKKPGIMLEEHPLWINNLLLSLTYPIDHAQADALRLQALADAPNVAGHNNDITFSWITDSDSRIGPVLELVTAGMYRWCPFTEIKRLVVTKPQTLLDMVWSTVALELVDGTMCKAWVPVRYPDSEKASEEALRLSKQTQWYEKSETAVCGLGQKVFSTDKGDIAFFEVGEMIILA